MDQPRDHVPETPALHKDVLAVQATAKPTNKSLTMFGGFVGTLPFVAPVVDEVWPQIAPAVLAGPAFTDALSAVIAGGIALGIAYFVRDRNNVPVA